MDDDPRSRPAATARDGYVGDDGFGIEEALDHRRRLAAEQRLGAAGEHGRQPELLTGEGRRMSVA